MPAGDLPYASRFYLMVIGIASVFQFFGLIGYSQSTLSGTRTFIFILSWFSTILLAISYFIWFREVEWRYDDDAFIYGQKIQDLRTARTTLGLIAMFCIYMFLSLVIWLRIGTLGIPLTWKAKWNRGIDQLLILATFFVGIVKLGISSIAFRDFHANSISLETYEQRLRVAREFGHAWAILTCLTTLDLSLRIVLHLRKLARVNIRDWISNAILWIIMPILFLRSGCYIVIEIVLPKILSIPLTDLNDPLSKQPSFFIIEAISVFVPSTLVFLMMFAWIFLTSSSFWYRWELIAREDTVATSKQEVDEKSKVEPSGETMKNEQSAAAQTV